MPIEFTCDCGKKYRVKDEMAGKKASCAKCKRSFVVPRVSPDASANQTKPPPKNKQASHSEPAKSATLTQRSDNGQHMFERAVMFAWQKQLWVEEELQGAWNLNLEEGIIDFSEIGKRFTVQVLGMEDLVTQKWLWAWADPKNDYSHKVLGAAIKLKLFGDKQDVPELVHGIFPLEIISAAEIATMVSGVLPCEGYWVAGEPGKFNVYFLMLPIEESSTKAPPVNRVARVIGETISTGTITDHRYAVTSYLKAIGYHASAEGDDVLGTGPQGDTVRLSFDDADRITNVNLTATPAGAATASNDGQAAAEPKSSKPINRTLMIGCTTAAVVGSLLLFLLIWPLIAVFIDGLKNGDKNRLPDVAASADQGSSLPKPRKANQRKPEVLDLAALKTEIAPFQDSPTGFIYNRNLGTTLLYDIDLQATIENQPFELKAMVGYKMVRGGFQFKSKLNVEDLPPNSPLKAVLGKWVLQSDGKLKIKPDGKIGDVENGNTQLPLLMGPVSVLPFSVLPANEAEKEKKFSHFYRSFSEPKSASDAEALLTTRQNLSEESNRAAFDYVFKAVLAKSNEKVTFLGREGNLVQFERSFQWIAQPRDGEPQYEVTGTARVEFDQAQGVVTQTRFTGVSKRVTASSSVDSAFELNVILRE